MRKYILLSATALACHMAMTGAAMAQGNPQAAPVAQDAKEIIVTGVFAAKAAEKAPISVNVVTAKDLAQQVAVSSADLLKNVPGVFVNSALGEIRNVVFSRGISANSLDGAGGYYYVSLQEDGLPVDLLTASNYGPDYYLRSDINLGRLEGLRGGTAVITGPNAPGGIFNYISKNGKTDPGVAVDLKFGLQGNGKLPQYRADAYIGGQIRDNLYYSIGGFLRIDNGTHDAGYALNKGGQVKANLLYDYEGGSLQLTGKYLNDANTWNEFTPAFGGTRIAPGFSNVTSNLQPVSGSHCYPVVGGGTGCWNPSNLVQNESIALGLNWHQDLGGTFKLDNKLRYTYNRSNWGAGAVLSVVSLQDPIVNILMGTAFLQPGTMNYYNGGQLMASQQINNNSPIDPVTQQHVSPNGSIFAPGYYNVTANNLPNQNIIANSNLPGNIGAYVGFGNAQKSWSNQISDQLTLTGDVGNHHLALGGFIGLAKLTTDYSGAPGIGLMTMTPQPQMLTVSYTPNGSSTPYLVTSPAGFGGMGQPALTSYNGTQKQYSLFFGDSWKVTDKLTLEAGGRWEAINYDIRNQSWNSSPFALFPMGFGSPVGGVDGNPYTLYDNGVSSAGAVYRTQRNYNYFNYSLAIDYDVNNNLTTYVRYSNGRKAPDFGGIQSINTPGQIATAFPAPQRIQQVELGIKYVRGGLNLQFFPFYSLLQNVNVPAVFNYTSGPQTGQQYVEPAFQGQIKTFGIEIAANARVTPSLSLHGNLTLQDPKASNFYNWAQGPKGDGTDDVKMLIARGDADNNPKIILRGGFDYAPITDVKLFGTVSYLGKRAANAANAFYLPAFTTVDMGASWNITKNIKAQFNVSNLFNQVGIMSWSATGFLASLNRQGLTAAQYNPNAIYPVVPSQARSFVWTVSARF